MDARVTHNRPQYLVRWKGFPPGEDMWLPWTEVHQLDVFKDYMREHPETPSPASMWIPEPTLTPPAGHRTARRSKRCCQASSRPGKDPVIVTGLSSSRRRSLGSLALRRGRSWGATAGTSTTGSTLAVGAMVSLQRSRGKPSRSQDLSNTGGRSWRERVQRTNSRFGSPSARDSRDEQISTTKGL